MVTDGNWTYHGDHLEMYRNLESLYCALETKIALWVNYASKKKKNLIEKDSRLWLPEVYVMGRGIE